jgi:hypothetical protein
MKATVKVKTEVEIKSVIICIRPRYIGDSDEDDMPTDFPLLCPSKTQWVANVDIESGQIAGWPIGEKREMSVKVCDAGRYTLRDILGNNIAVINGYVPNGVVPGEYGDYVDLKIDENGFITNWPKHPDISAFFKDEDED